jgi:hypothetical protein
MKLEFEEGPAIENPSNAAIAEALPKVGGERGNFAILAEAEQEYMQTGRSAGDTSKFTLEYRKEGKQYQVVDPVPLDEAIAAFQDYASGKANFKERHRWRELDFSEAGNGCLGTIAASFLLIAMLTLMAV